MRPLYETAQDRLRQRAVMDAFQRRYQCQLVEMPAKCNWDYEIWRNEMIVALAEVKCRRNAMCKYPTYLLSKMKADAIVQACASLSLSPLLIVQWSDTAGWVWLNDGPFEEGHGGRVDRNDPRDMEQVIYIPISKFTKFI
jgi:hypothetical protein